MSSFHSDGQSEWYALHVRSRHEKVVAAHLDTRQIEHWLPLLERRSKWSDRCVTIREPLFPCYLFVKPVSQEFQDVLRTRGVVGFVSANGTPVPVPVTEIDAVRVALEHKLRCDPYPGLAVGKQVTILRGPLKGHSGRLVQRNGKYRVVLSIALIGGSVAVEMHANDLSAV